MSSVILRELALWLLSQRQPTVLLLISCFLEHTVRAVDTESRAFAGAWRAGCYQQTGTEKVLVSGPGAHSGRRIGLDLSFCRNEKRVPFLVPASSLCCAELAVAQFLLCAKLPRMSQATCSLTKSLLIRPHNSSPRCLMNNKRYSKTYLPIFTIYFLFTFLGGTFYTSSFFSYRIIKHRSKMTSDHGLRCLMTQREASFDRLTKPCTMSLPTPHAAHQAQ